MTSRRQQRRPRRCRPTSATRTSCCCTDCSSRRTRATTPRVRVTHRVGAVGGRQDRGEHRPPPCHLRRPPDPTCDAARPTGFLDMKGKAKWDAWNANKGACVSRCRAGGAPAWHTVWASGETLVPCWVGEHVPVAHAPDAGTNMRVFSRARGWMPWLQGRARRTPCRRTSTSSLR
jgi:hypothetical protein